MKLPYLSIALGIFLIEVCIAKFADSASFIRVSLGDVLVIVLLYFLIRGLRSWSAVRCASIALAFGIMAETMQYFQLGDRIGLERGSILSVVLGTTFSAEDLLMYAFGAMLGLALDRLLGKIFPMFRSSPLSNP